MIFGPGLLSTLGAPHRKQRKLLNPVFSANHMRYMTPIFYRVADRVRVRANQKYAPLTISMQLGEAVSAQVKAGSGKTEIDMFHWMARTALELIGQGGLGYSFDPLTEERHDELGDALRQFMCVALRLGILFVSPLMLAHTQAGDLPLRRNPVICRVLYSHWLRRLQAEGHRPHAVPKCPGCVYGSRDADSVPAFIFEHWTVHMVLADIWHAYTVGLV